MPSNNDNRVALRGLLSLSRTRTQADYLELARLSSLLDGDVDDRTSELQAALVEYESLRQESMNTINNRTQILMFGLAGMAALAGTALTIDNLGANKLLVYFIFSGAIPIAAAFVLIVWVSEAVRDHRVGNHLAAETEARINALLGLGYSEKEALHAVKQLPEGQSLSDGIRAALKLLSKA